MSYLPEKKGFKPCVHIRNMHTACHELIVCESYEAAKAVCYAVKVLDMEPEDATKHEAVNGLDMSCSINREIFWNEVTNGKIIIVSEVDYRNQNDDKSFYIRGGDYMPVNAENIDFCW